MAKQQSPIINTLTYQLPFDLANQIYREYEDRMKEIAFTLENGIRFRHLRNDMVTIEALLAMSIFHKRVISNLDAAIKFHHRVTSQSQAEAIRMGSYLLNGDERNKILGVVMNFNQLMRRFNITQQFMDYYLTRDFLINVQQLKLNQQDASDTEKENGSENN